MGGQRTSCASGTREPDGRLSSWTHPTSQGGNLELLGQVQLKTRCRCDLLAARTSSRLCGSCHALHDVCRVCWTPPGPSLGRVALAQGWWHPKRQHKPRHNLLPIPMSMPRPRAYCTPGLSASGRCGQDTGLQVARTCCNRQRVPDRLLHLRNVRQRRLGKLVHHHVDPRRRWIAYARRARGQE